MLVKKGVIKEFVKTKYPELRISKDLFETFSKKVEVLIEAAVKRTTLNKRKTIMPHDI